LIHRHDPGQPCNASCSDQTTPLTQAISDLSHAAISLGNHTLRTCVTPPADWAERLEYASRESERISKEFRALADDARDFSRRIA
jgi:hypothetical protein